MADFIPFNKPPVMGDELQNIARAALEDGHLTGDGPFTKKCQQWLEFKLGAKKVLLTQSCTSGLEMSALLCGVGPGDEVIMPSFTFVSTANPFALRGATPVFVDVRPDTMNIDETLIEQAITEKTKAIVPIHYAGFGAEMDTIMEIANRHDLVVIEDAAQGMGSSYKGRPLGTIGHMASFSFHATKNVISGEGGALVINDDRFIERAEIIWEKGTNRRQFLRGQVDKYTWVDVGSSFLPSELTAAFLYAQLQQTEEITYKRCQLYKRYQAGLADLDKKGVLGVPEIPEGCTCNGHIFYVFTASIDERGDLIDHLKSRDIASAFHYVPLHSSPAGKRLCRVNGSMENTDNLSARLLRLPMYYSLSFEEVDRVVAAVREFYGE